MRSLRVTLCLLSAATMVATSGPLPALYFDLVMDSRSPEAEPITYVEYASFFAPVWVLVIVWGMLIRPGRERWAVAALAAAGLCAWRWSAEAGRLIENGVSQSCIGMAALLTVGMLMRVFVLQLGWWLRLSIPVLRRRWPVPRSRPRLCCAASSMSHRGRRCLRSQVTTSTTTRRYTSSPAVCSERVGSVGFLPVTCRPVWLPWAKSTPAKPLAAEDPIWQRSARWSSHQIQPDEHLTRTSERSYASRPGRTTSLIGTPRSRC